MKLKQIALAVISLSCINSIAYSALFYQYNQDAAGLGDAQAGQAALANDASTEFYNPAGLIRIPNQQLVLGDNLAMPSYKYKGSAEYTNGFNENYSGSAQGAEFYHYPYMHYAAPISSKWAFGFGISSPFVIDSNWGGDSFVRNMATTSKLRTYDVTIDLAYAITEKFSVGAGADIVRVIFSDYNYATPYNGGVSEYQTEADGYDWAESWHAGALFQLSDHTRLGATYHEKINFDAEGRAATTAQNGNDLVNSSQYEIAGNLPATTTASLYQRINDRLTLLLGASYLQWEQFSEVTFHNVPTQGGIISKERVDYGLKDSWLASLGVHYVINPKMMLRVGVGYESSPVEDDSVYLQMPSSEIYAASLGFHYLANEIWSVDVGWSHYFFKDKDVATTSDYAQNNTTTAGTIDGSADMIGVQFTWNMF